MTCICGECIGEEDTCCDEQPLCGLRRTGLRIVLLCVVASASLAASLYLPFSIGLVSCTGCVGEDSAAREGGYVKEAVFVFFAINAALGFCIASVTVCFWGDVELCALRGSEKRLLWCLLLSPFLGALCLCVSARTIFSPTENEFCCMLAAEQDSEQGPEPGTVRVTASPCASQQKRAAAPDNVTIKRPGPGLTSSGSPGRPPDASPGASSHASSPTYVAAHMVGGLTSSWI